MKIGLFYPQKSRDYNNVSASNWIRCLQMADMYRALGNEVYINNPFRRYDLSVFFRGVRPKHYRLIKWLKLISGKVLWDTVVNYFVEHEASSKAQVDCARRIAGSVDGIIVSSKTIGEYAAQYNETYFMPDPVNLEHFGNTKKKPNFDKPVWGWSGVSVKADVLSSYREDLDGNSLIISDAPPQLPFEYSFRKWRYETFPSDIVKADIGFFPRDLNTAYNLGHSSFKILVYAVQGVPVVASRIPSYVELANSYDGLVFLEDYESLESALVELRGRSMDPAQVREEYSTIRWAREMNTIFHKVVQG